MTMSPPSIRCRGNWKIHKRASEPDRWLDELGYFRKHTARDSSCLFRIVSENVFNNQRYFNIVRKDCVNFMATNRTLFEGSISCPFDTYLKEMSNPGEWGGFIEISAMSHLYRRDFIIFDSNKGPQTNIFNGYGSIIHLFYIQDSKHFDAVYTKDYINISSFCQSLIYEVLYGGVFKIKDIPYAIDRMLHDKIPSNHIEYFMVENVERRRRQNERDLLDSQTFESFGRSINGKLEEDEYRKRDRNSNTEISCKYGSNVDKSMINQTLNIFFNGDHCDINSQKYVQIQSAKNMLEQGITPFPYKVAKALDPDIYRNIEFDVWSEMRREIRYGSRYTDGSCLQVGVKCLCRLQADQTIPYHCHIQEMNSDGGPCLVFIEELGEKKIVNYDHLEPLPLEELRPWAPPFRHSHNYAHFFSLNEMLQHLGNMTKKNNITKMRNKLKSISEGENMKIRENEQILDSNYRTNNNYNKMNWKDEDALFVREKQEMMCTEKNLVYDISTITSSQCKMLPSSINLSTYHQLDYVSFDPYSVEVTAMPQMEDHRDATVQSHYRHASDHLVHSAHPNVDVCIEHHIPQLQHPGSTELGSIPLTSPATVSASASVNSSNLSTYTGNAAYGFVPHFNMYGMPQPNLKPQLQAKPPSFLLCAPPTQCPPPFVNTHVHKSLNPNGSDLPMNDIPTLRYFFNLGVDCMWGGLCSTMAPAQVGSRVSPVNELTQELQHNLNLSDHSSSNILGVSSNGDHTKLNQNNKNIIQGQSTGGHGEKVQSLNNNQQGKTINGSRPPLGPRFKRSGNGGDNTQVASNKSHFTGSKGVTTNQRRNSQQGEIHSSTAPPECLPEGSVVPYIAYPPPPFYPVPYIPMEEGLLGYAPPPLLYAPLPDEAEGTFSAASYMFPPPHYYAPPAHVYLPTDQPSK